MRTHNACVFVRQLTSLLDDSDAEGDPSGGQEDAEIEEGAEKVKTLLPAEHFEKELSEQQR